MAKLLMITGLGGGMDLARGKRGALFNTLEEFHNYWERIDIVLPKVSNISARVLFDNVFVHCSSWSFLFYPLWFLKKTLEIYRQQKFDLMTVHEFPPFYNGIAARILWSKIKAPYILEIHHIPGYPKSASLKEWLYKNLMKMLIKFDAAKATAVRVVNQHQTPNFLIKAGILKEKIIYIPSFYIDLNIFRQLEVQKKIDLVFAARLEKNKGIILLLDAIRNVKLQNPNIKLLIIGNGPLKAQIQKYIKEHGLANNVFLSGWLETSNDVAQAYNSARIFINPSLNEGGPRVMLEAMACGLPVITTRVGVALDLFKNEESGLFTSWEPEEMAEKIIYLLKNENLQKKFSLAGQQIVSQFEKKEAIKNYAEELKKLI